MEEANNGSKVGGEIEYYRVTNESKDGHNEDGAAVVLGHTKHDLQGKVVRELHGEGWSGRVRGLGLGSTPSMIFHSKKYSSAQQQTMEAKEEALASKILDLQAEIVELRAVVYSIIAERKSPIVVPPLISYSQPDQLRNMEPNIFELENQILVLQANIVKLTTTVYALAAEQKTNSL